MKLVVQRVNHAKVVSVKNSKILGKIDKGLFVLLGVGRDDDEKKAETLAQKLSKLRIISDEKGKMNLSILDSNGQILVVSQFTLYADTSGGNRPSFIDAAEPVHARKLYEHFIKCLISLGINVRTGSFGDYMRISLELDGPVTINLIS
ncbi:D-tyrosyl-tRNA(Tyr) deacylase [Candidatus Woesebacteria bacterium RBG_13_34_9]|uniref:D-aminoacyl-tRNA deacylase n=1 Tax=Candidatus Woesebacteria bacterium RBG_13_34_9 TaxID=1802477 RepID=A0A1F7X7B9_9BACT|nr:MAG: D-tyrosyl-tRNA(Tyr) deacylase [Candidatus Woesebacteria bacterium RBG_13_34_9]